MWKLVGKLLITGGLICFLIASYFVYERVNPNRLRFNGYKPSDANVSFSGGLGVPQYLIIKDLGINLKVVPSKIINDRWETTFEGVSFLSTSPLPGTYGNSIFYGHNWKSLLGDLINAKPGQTIEVVVDGGRTEKFVITTVQVVSPNDKSILDSTNDTRITIYTCTGFLDAKRLVVTALKTSN